MNNLFRGRVFGGKVPATAHEMAKPMGIFAVSLDSKGLSPRLNAKVRWDEIVWSARLLNGGPGLPNEFDLVATYNNLNATKVRSFQGDALHSYYARPERFTDEVHSRRIAFL